jgi:hypothetical protein
MYEGLNKNGHSQSLEEHIDNKHIVETEPSRERKTTEREASASDYFLIIYRER